MGDRDAGDPVAGGGALIGGIVGDFLHLLEKSSTFADILREK